MMLIVWGLYSRISLCICQASPPPRQSETREVAQLSKPMCPRGYIVHDIGNGETGVPSFMGRHFPTLLMPLPAMKKIHLQYVLLDPRSWYTFIRLVDPYCLFPRSSCSWYTFIRFLGPIQFISPQFLKLGWPRSVDPDGKQPKKAL